MKKLKGLFITLAMLIIMPFTVFAEDKEKINVYIFRGEGCGYCARALEFFNGLDEEYKSYFNLVEREVWKNEENANLMNKVADYFNETVSGVPYIIIGDKTFKGYDEAYNEEIKEAIKAGYENTDGSYQDVVGPIINGDAVPEKENSSAITLIIILAVLAGIGFIVYMARED